MTKRYYDVNECLCPDESRKFTTAPIKYDQLLPLPQAQAPEAHHTTPSNTQNYRGEQSHQSNNSGKQPGPTDQQLAVGTANDLFKYNGQI